MNETLFEQFRDFYSKFPISVRSGNDISFFVNHREVEMVHNFETHNLLVINNTTKRLKGVSFDITFTDDGKDIILFGDL